MLFPATHTLAAIRKEFGKLAENLADAHQAGSPAQVIAACLNMLQRREHLNLDFVQRQEASLAEALAKVSASLKHEKSVSASVKGAVAEISNDLASSQEESNLAAREAQWREHLLKAEQALMPLVAMEELSAATRTDLVDILAHWESEDYKAHLGDPSTVDSAAADDTALDVEKWQHYLQQRFDEPGLSVGEFKALAGGFGKQTIFFSVNGESLQGDYVIRRDYTDEGMDNDCHTVDKEYPVIKAVHEAGFAAPEALWLDTEHASLPGGNFIVMRRAAGETGGTVFDSHQEISDKLLNTLASACARLHSLPPLESLGDLTSSICQASWRASTRDVVHAYLEDWYRMYRQTQHTPSPALVSLYTWLLSNIPDNDGKPVLLHGDIGFQNMLLTDGDLSCLLDWEFAHVGDPAEDLAYIKNTIGHLLDWDQFMAIYTRETGIEIDRKRLQFFQVWGQVRNATAANIMSSLFARGEVDELKLAVLPFTYITHFLDEARRLIKHYEAW